MQPLSDEENLRTLRSKVIGLGEKSFQKSYYPELQRRLDELERFRALLDQSTDCYFLLECPSGMIKDVTEATCLQLGYSREELMECAFGTLCSTAEEINSYFSQYHCRLPGRYVVDTYLFRKDGQPCSVEVVFSPVSFDQMQYCVAIARDNSDRKRSEQAIRQLNAALEQRIAERTKDLERTIKELEAFSYSVSHDLRAPLRGIDGWSLALLEDYGDQFDEQGRIYLERVRAEAQRMGMLIEDLLHLSRITQMELHKEQVDLSSIARVVVIRMKESEPQREVDWRIQEGLVAQGDARLLEVALSNLLGNAFKFTSKNFDAKIEFGQTIRQDETVFFVRDNGVGFDMDGASKLFGAFQRLHKASDFPGTGVGLAIVQRIIHRHGGRIWAEAQPNRGATFYFTLDEN